MKKNQSNKWFLTRLALPVATAIIMLTGCKENNKTNETNSCIKITIIDNDQSAIDKLLQENRRLTDSLNIINRRLDDCEATRTKRCPCDKKPVQKKTAPKKTAVSKPTTNQVIIDNDNGNNTVIIGNNNTVNNTIINNTVIDTLARTKMTQRVFSGYAKKTYTYTK